MTPDVILLAGTAAAIAAVHTLLGPDHYLPFSALAKSRGWNLAKTLKITLWCGLGHLVGSVALGVVGITLGSALAGLTAIEAVRGEMAAWLLCGFGLAYMVWGFRQAWRKKPHVHWHRHGDLMHCHVHNHHSEHAHLHQKSGQGTFGPWLIFIIFVLGPCEPLIPLLMYPAATHSWTGVLLVTSVFGIVTVLTMLVMVAALHIGLRRLQAPGLGRFAHALAGGTLFLCGASMALLGL